jgi:DNA-directed RNA polymerase subunit RPC12/RpoP
MHIDIDIPGPWGLLLLVVFLASIGWAFADAQERSKSGCLVALLVAFLCWPLGLIVWLVCRPNRPEPPKATSERATRIACQCGRRILVEEKMAGEKVLCVSCGREVVVPVLSRLQELLEEEGRTRNKTWR